MESKNFTKVFESFLRENSDLDKEIEFLPYRFLIAKSRFRDISAKANSLGLLGGTKTPHLFLKMS